MMKYIFFALLTFSTINFAGEVENDQTPRYRNRNLFKKLLARFGYFEHQKFWDGSIPLHVHVSLANLQAVIKSLDNGAPINEKNNNKLSALNAMPVFPNFHFGKRIDLAREVLKNLNLSVQDNQENVFAILHELIQNGAFVDHTQEVQGRKPAVLERIGEKPLFDRVQKEKAKWCKVDPKSTVCSYCTKMEEILRTRIKDQPEQLREEYAQPQQGKK